VLSDFWSPMPEIHRIMSVLSSSVSHGTLVQIVDPAEESLPYRGRVEFVEPEDGAALTAGRAELWVTDYAALVARHRDQIRAETRRLDWQLTQHTTDRSAAELLLFLHSVMTVNKTAPRLVTDFAGRIA
jgi:uncharacterized protein (DUF58 family)